MPDDVDPIRSSVRGVRARPQWEPTPLDIVETVALSELSSPEAVAAFAAVRARLRPEQANRFTELAVLVDRLAGPGFAEAADADLHDALRSIPRTEPIDRLVRSVDGPIGKLALAQLLRVRSPGSTDHADQT